MPGEHQEEERKRDVDPPGEVELTVPSAEERKGFTKKCNDTGAFHVVPHRSTSPARRRITSQRGRGVVLWPLLKSSGEKQLTPARASTRHPAKHRSKGLTCGLATAEHRLHCYVDHNNSGCCSGYEPARGEAPGHYNNISNLYATVSFREISRAFPIKFTSRYT